MAIKYKSYILLLILLLLYSCDISTYTNSNMENGVLNVDLGTKQFNDPFPYDGHRPQVLKDIITNYFSWAWTKNDTIEFERNIGISFNEDAVRSKSRMFLYPYIEEGYADYVKVYLNDAVVSEKNPIIVNATLEETDLHLRIRVHPELGDSIVNGFIVAIQENVDEINDAAIQNDSYPIVQWTSTQEIGWPLLLWLILLAIIAGLLYGIVMLVLFLIESMSAISVSVPTVSFSRSSPSRATKSFIKKINKEKKIKKEKKEKKEEDKKMKRPKITPSQGIYIMNKIDEWHEKSGGNIAMLPSYWKTVMMRYYAHDFFKTPTTKYGSWSGKERESKWTPYDSQMPLGDANDINYNPDKKTLKQMMRKYGQDYIQFNRKQLPDFTPFAETNIEVEIELLPYAFNIRAEWQRKAKERLARKHNYSSGQEFEEKYCNKKQLTLHEHIDGKTVLLVKYPIHSSIPHNGGVSLVKMLCIPDIPTFEESKQQLRKLGIWV